MRFLSHCSKVTKRIQTMPSLGELTWRAIPHPSGRQFGSQTSGLRVTLPEPAVILVQPLSFIYSGEPDQQRWPLRLLAAEASLP